MLPRRSLLSLGLGTCCGWAAGCEEAPRPDAARVSPRDGLDERGDTPTSLTLGITPSSGKDTAALLAPLTAYLSARLTLPTAGITAASYDELQELIDGAKIDIGVFSPAAYVKAGQARFAALPIATATRAGSPTYLGYLVARRQGAPNLAALEGKRVAWVDRSSTSGYLYARALLRARGHDPDAFFGASVFAGDHRAALRQLLDGAVDAAAVASPFVDPDSDVRVERADALAVVAKTRRIPLDCVVVHKRIQRRLGEQLQRSLFALIHDLEASRALAHSWGLSGFVRPLDDRYDEVAQALQQESG